MSGTKQSKQASQQDRRTDQAVEDSFPASDPPSQTPASGIGDADADEAKGMPHSDRHATETAAGRTEEQRPAEHKH